jgi:hypothetical protein
MDNYVKRKNISESYTARQKRGKKGESVRERKRERERERELESEKVSAQDRVRKLIICLGVEIMGMKHVG